MVAFVTDSVQEEHVDNLARKSYSSAFQFSKSDISFMLGPNPNGARV